MTQFMFVSQWVVFALVVVVAFRHSYRAGRITRFSICFTWFMLTLQMLVFAIYGGSLGRPEREKWTNQFPDGQHVLGMLMVFGWMNGVLVAVLAVGVRRIVRKEPLFRL